jgi:hypothetical protein
VDILNGANLALALAIEIVMLVALGYWALVTAPVGWVSWLAALAIVAVAIALWAIWGATKSARRLKMPQLLVFKVGMFGAAAVALWAAGQPLWAGVFAVAVALNLVLARARGQE